MANPLGKRLEDMVMDYRLGKRQGLAPQALLALADPLIEQELPKHLATTAHIDRCLGSEDGMFSPWVVRQFRELQECRGANVIDFPAMDEGESA